MGIYYAIKNKNADTLLYDERTGQVEIYEKERDAGRFCNNNSQEVIAITVKKLMECSTCRFYEDSVCCNGKVLPCTEELIYWEQG